jgi:prepilin-type N-terminal cleavage/methylation domain-containing protein
MRHTTLSGSARRGFTLIELLVVIAIIAVLAGVALPALQNAMLGAQQSKAMQNAHQIGLALRMFANDNEGAYPSGKNAYGEEIKFSNDAFRSLMPAYLDNEQVFAVARSKAGPKADSRIEPATEILKPGENHFAYISGLNSASNSTWPLIVDSTDGSGKYTDKEGEPGGTWKGTKAIVINVDSSARCVALAGTGSSRFIPRTGEPTQNALDLSYMGSGVKLLEPATP